MNRSITEALAWTLLHFLWQGGLIALLAGLTSIALRRAKSTTRYALFCGALALMVVVPVITFAVLNVSPAPAPIARATPAPADSGAVTSAPAPAQPEPVPSWLPWLVRVWLAGVVLLSLRSAGGLILAQRLKYWRTTPAAESIQRTASRLRARLDLRRAVRVFESAVAQVPSAIGCLKPVVLLPVSALTALTPEQIELLLAHELAHIRRHDYFINLLQTGVETVLFYHPAVWWISSRIRAEREHCCDDLAIQACGDDALAYARTLTQLEGLQSRPVRLVLAANGGPLLARIQRLANRESAGRHTPPVWMGVLLPVALVLLAALSVRPSRVEATGVDTSAVDSEIAEPPEPAAPEENHPEAPKRQIRGHGYLAGLASAGYTKISVDEIIALKQNGVEPQYIAEMMSAGLGVPTVDQLIKLKQHGVDPAFVARLARSGLVKDIAFEMTIRLHDYGVNTDDMTRIRALGFGPFAADDVVKLRDHGVTYTAFEALKEAGISAVTVEDAIQIQQNGVNAPSIRSMKDQGFNHLSLEQIIKLRRAGVI
jgi:beta-lactamase regulating signal transducer with metallopeptidase domain